MTTGELIKKYRKARGLTQVELAEKCDLTDSAIRNYELGNRTPSESHIENIAKALEVAPAALLGITVATSREALEYLFRIDEELGLKPVKNDEGDITLMMDRKNRKAPKLAMALNAWLAQEERLEAGEITQAEYELWKAGFGA